jgi:hypothetical protein
MAFFCLFNKLKFKTQTTSSNIEKIGCELMFVVEKSIEAFKSIFVKSMFYKEFLLICQLKENKAYFYSDFKKLCRQMRSSFFVQTLAFA